MEGVYEKHVVCSNQEHRDNESSHRDITRTSCDACVQFSVNKEVGDLESAEDYT